MSRARDSGGPAFSAAWGNPIKGGDYVPGMSLRDWFAGQALVGITSNSYTPWSPDAADIEDAQIASAAYDLADAMIEARKATEGEA